MLERTRDFIAAKWRASLNGLRGFFAKKRRKARRRQGYRLTLLWLVWLSLLLVGVIVVVIGSLQWIYGSASFNVANVVRVIGVIYQVIGLAIVVYVLNRTRVELFEEKGLMAMFREQIAVALSKSPPRSGGLNSVESGSDTAAIKVRTKELLLEERVKNLEDIVSSMPSELEQTMTDKINKMRKEILKTQKSIKSMNEKAKKVFLDLYIWELVSLVCLFFGIVAASMPDEIATLLG